jgi:hypothetical protein
MEVVQIVCQITEIYVCRNYSRPNIVPNVLSEELMLAVRQNVIHSECKKYKKASFKTGSHRNPDLFLDSLLRRMILTTRQDRQYAYNVTVGRVFATAVAVISITYSE